MKKLLTVFTMALCAMAPYARDWEDPQIVGRNAHEIFLQQHRPLGLTDR